MKSKMAKAKLGCRSVEDLDNEDRVRVLGIVDKLRELGVNEDISLPQVSTGGSPFAVDKRVDCSTACCRWRSIEWKIVAA